MVEKKPLMFLLPIVALPLFLNLGQLCIRLWDESRLVANTIEMYHNGNFIVTYFDGKPDMWNTKPPLMIWIHWVMVHLFGFNEWSFRLVSASLGLIISLFVYRFTLSKTKNVWIALAAAFILVTTRGFVDSHVTRTGDYDMLLIFFAVLAHLHLYSFVEKSKPKYLYYSAIFFGMAVLAKGPAVGLFFPGVLVFMFVAKKILPLLRNGHSYLALLLFFIIALPYYFIREHYNPGYLQAVYDNELGGRFLTVLDEQGGAWYRYLEGMTGRNFTLWFVFIPLGLFFAFKEQRQHIKAYILFCALTAVAYFIMISAAKTKHGWYDAPIYPFLSVIVAYAIYQCVERAFYSFKGTKGKVFSLSIVFFAMLFTLAYILIFVENVYRRENEMGTGKFDMAYYIRDKYLNEGDMGGKNVFVIENQYNPTANLYFEKIRQKGGIVSYIDFNKMPQNQPIWMQGDNQFEQLKTLNPDRNIVVIDSFFSMKVFLLKD